MQQEVLILLAALGLIGFGGCARTEPPRDVVGAASLSGVDRARRDIAAGHLTLQRFGIASVQDGAFAELLRSRLGVELRGSSGCAIAPEELASMLAYNRVMMAEIERRFGPGRVQRLREEAATNAATQPAA